MVFQFEVVVQLGQCPNERLTYTFMSRPGANQWGPHNFFANLRPHFQKPGAVFATLQVTITDHATIIKLEHARIIKQTIRSIYIQITILL